MLKILENILIELGKMSWSIYWGLAFGFMLSAFIRTFVATQTVSSKLGKDGIKSLALASLFGAVSSSCSYAAASMSRTLLIKGASWTNAIAFLIASTNLVFEIFIVIFTLLGAAFVWGEIFGGIIFIVITSLIIVFFFPKKVDQEAHKHINKVKEETHHHGRSADGKGNFKDRVLNASSHFYMDVMMVGPDIIVGVAIAATLSVVVPKELWTKIFLTDH